MLILNTEINENATVHTLDMLSNILRSNNSESTDHMEDCGGRHMCQNLGFLDIIE